MVFEKKNDKETRYIFLNDTQKETDYGKNNI
jgi:hypothetical protein